MFSFFSVWLPAMDLQEYIDPEVPTVYIPQRLSAFIFVSCDPERASSSDNMFECLLPALSVWRSKGSGVPLTD